MSKKVVVTDISEKAGEKTVKDFFLFCGKIKAFELYKDETSDKQIAYVTFERDTAAKTALMLTNAVIGDSQITVKSVDDGPGCDDSDDGYGLEDSKTAKFAEILAAGYSLQDAIFEKGMVLNDKYHFSDTVKVYIDQLQEKLKDLDQKFQVTTTVTTRASDINDKYSVLDNAQYVIEKAHGKVNNFLDTPTGKMIRDYLSCTQKQVSDVNYLARQIADNKKQDRNFNPLPSHSQSDEISAQ